MREWVGLGKSEGEGGDEEAGEENGTGRDRRRRIGCMKMNLICK